MFLAIADRQKLEELMSTSNTTHVTSTAHIHPYLSSFVNYFQPVKFVGFDVSEGTLLPI